VALPSARAALTLTADRADELSCSLGELTLAFDAPADCPAADLTQLAAGTAARVTGLLEPLKVYEVDPTRTLAKLRSAAPTERGGQLYFYELTLAGRQTASLKRYRAARAAAGRQAVPFALTHESVVKVVEELLQAAAEPGEPR
jgi:hypothetical protein